MIRDRFSPAAARRIALAAQGLADPRPSTPADRRAILRLIGRLGLIQMDSVNVLVRSHYMPLFSRLGPYDPAIFDAAAYDRRRGLFEYWGHEASLLPLATQPLMRWRMERARTGDGVYSGLARFAREKPDFVAAVLDQVSRRGPISASELEEAGQRSGKWWGWNEGKRAIEVLFWSGQVTTAGRRNFERVYDLPERVFPAAVLGQPTPSEEEAQRALIMIAARAMGVATAFDLRDYFRLPVKGFEARLIELVEAGELVEVAVEGWRHPAYFHPEARVPRQAKGRALLSPFDSLVWERARTERIFGFRYRIEIYVPAHLRQDGYYVLPFLLGDRLAARVDLKAMRKEGILSVQAAHLEPGGKPDEVAGALAEELALMARWLGLERIVVVGKGDLAPALESALS